MAGISEDTLLPLDGWAHVEQSIDVLFSTRQGELYMHEWFGNPGLKLLGENSTRRTVLLWFTICWVMLELFEPRFRISQFVPNDLDRLGVGDFTMHGVHRPYAHLDWTQAALFVSVSGGDVKVGNAL